ncbi:MAG: MATE family efflux transporter [Oscillospiraceae bacterium]
MQQSEKSNYLAEEKISKLLFKFSVPCIISLLVSAFYNIVDQIFIGHSELGYLGNAATGIVFPILIISLAFAWCFGDGAAAYLSICQGKKDSENAHKCIGSAITITLIVSIVLMFIFLVFKEPLLRIFGASDATIVMSMDYFTIIIASLPIFMLMNMMNSVIRADGSPGFSMASMTIGAVINIILDPIFIFGLHWGIKGAAYATVIGQIISFTISAVYFTRTKTFKLTAVSFIPNFKVFSHVIGLGISTFITEMSIVVTALICNIMLFHYGTLSIYGPDIPISVISIETKVFTIVINIVVGIILGAQPILGYNYGAKKYDRVKETYKLVLIATLIIGILSTFIFEIFTQQVIGIFGAGTALYNEFAQMTFRIFLSLVTFTCVIKVTSIFFQAVGQPIKAAITSLTREIICFVPLVIILARMFGIKGILFAGPISDFIAMIVTIVLTVQFFRSLDKEKSADEAMQKQIIQPSHKGVIVTIAREHGSAGKQIGQLVAKQLNIPCYYKETAMLAAQQSGLAEQFISEINSKSPAVLHDLYLSTNVIQQAIVAQQQVIENIAAQGSCVIIGRAADYVLRDHEDVVRIFIYAPSSYRIKKVIEMYGDTKEQAEKSLKRSDAARAAYYKNISGLHWGEAKNYELCIDGSIGINKTADAICAYLKSRAER